MPPSTVFCLFSAGVYFIIQGMNPENHPFSEREKDVIQLLLQGRGNKQIALELGIANRTVEFHLSNIYAKLGVNTRSEAILKFTESRLRESTGGQPVDSTVAHSGVSTENGFKSILRRNVMKTLYYYLIGGSLALVLLAAMVLTKPFTQTVDPIPPTQASQSAATLSTAADVQSPIETLPVNQQPSIIIPPHTVNGYTAAIESYYVDASHIIFQVRLTGGGISFGNELFFDRIGSVNLYDENGGLINTSIGWGPAIDPALYQFEFVPVTLLKGDRIKGQFAFDVTDAPEYEKILAQFRFDFDLPIHPDVRFHPKLTVSANNMEILLDSITVTPTSTQVYLCFPPPSFADWNIGNQSVLQIDGQEAVPNYFRVLFDSAIGGERTAGSEPYWTPPVKNGRCVKSGFPVGSSNPTSLTLTIPQLEKSESDLLVANQFSVDYPGLSEKQAYYKFLEEHGNVYKGAWTFTIQLTP
jgi:DNA-binding CsgD family transcriptional regulator